MKLTPEEREALIQRALDRLAVREDPKEDPPPEKPKPSIVVREGK